MERAPEEPGGAPGHDAPAGLRDAETGAERDDHAARAMREGDGVLSGAARVMEGRHAPQRDDERVAREAHGLAVGNADAEVATVGRDALDRAGDEARGAGGGRAEGRRPRRAPRRLRRRRAGTDRRGNSSRARRPSARRRGPAAARASARSAAPHAPRQGSRCVSPSVLWAAPAQDGCPGRSVHNALTRRRRGTSCAGGRCRRTPRTRRHTCQARGRRTSARSRRPAPRRRARPGLGRKGCGPRRRS